MSERNDIVITGIVAFVAIGLLLILILPQSSAEDILIINTATNTTCQDITAICYDSVNDIGSNQVVINSTNATPLILNSESTSVFGIKVSAFANSPRTEYYRANGNHTNPTAVTTGNIIGANQGNGYDGDSYETGANFRFIVTETWDNSGHGSKVELRCVKIDTTAAFTCGTFADWGMTDTNIDYAIRTVTAVTYSATLNDYIILCDTTSNSVTITLPTPNSSDNRLFILKRISGGANTCIIATAGSELIEGNASVALAAFGSFANNANSNDVTLVWDGSQWWNVD